MCTHASVNIYAFPKLNTHTYTHTYIQRVPGGKVNILGGHTGRHYLEFLQNEKPQILQLEDVPLATRIAVYFQRDGAPPHYTRLVTQHLNDIFLTRWIGRGSTINWPTGSPDLTPLDFCLWAWMKNEMYKRKVDMYMGRTARSHNGRYCPHKGTSR
jgi:hypothetical protein